MVRKLILTLVILAIAVVPMPALARDEHHDFDRGHGHFNHHERFEHRPFSFGVYAPPQCYWQPGYWANQPYVDGWGQYSYAPQWVQPQYVCS